METVSQLEFLMICPKCYQQDCLRWVDLEKHVLNSDMEGQYKCPYGCGVVMGLCAVGDSKAVGKKSGELFEKYYDKLDPNCLTLQMSQ